MWRIGIFAEGKENVPERADNTRHEVDFILPFHEFKPAAIPQ
jgi:hypothetical protein